MIVQEKSTGRYRYIDYYKAIAIILVVIGHINFANESIRPWIYAFHMPAFFFVSGLLLKDSQEVNLKNCIGSIWKKVQVLIIPYFIWALIYSSLELNNIIKIIYGSQIMLKSAGSLTSLWYLTTLFLSFTFYELTRFVFKKRFGVSVKIILMICTFVVAAIVPNIKRGYPWNLNVAFYSFGFLLMGNILFPIIYSLCNKINERGDEKRLIICICALGISFVGTLLYQFNIPKNSQVINTAKAIYGSFPMFLLVAAFGIAFILFLSILLDHVLPKKSADLFSFIGENTFCIFVIHKPIAQKVFGKLFSVVSVPNSIAIIVTCIGTLIICCVITLFINRYLPSIIGKTHMDNDLIKMSNEKQTI